jgi:cysteinyl-tRNA synthetase
MIKLYNSLTRRIEEFIPLNPPEVGIYTCGPTVYKYLTIGNFRTYTITDFLVRTLKFNNYKVHYIMNITDVGHLTGDNEGDADTGEDKLAKSAQKEGKTAWDIADFYTHEFLGDFQKLNLTPPEHFTKATEHIPEQIELVKKLETNGLTYRTSDGIYFDVDIYEQKTGKKYGQLSDLDQIKEGARVKVNPQKHSPRDFALWKFSEKKGDRHMEWESPWGLGFPGWHIECSAMSMKYLGETFDIHAGGEDLKQTHHPNEIAQSEGATGKQFVKHWFHVRFLKVDGQKMGKSLGNAYTVSDIINKNFHPLALRYFYLTAHYSEQQNFTWDSLKNAQNSLNNLYDIIRELKTPKDIDRRVLSEDKLGKIEEFESQFRQAINDNLNLPQALATTWEVAKSNIPSTDKYDLLILFDEVLGLKLADVEPKQELKVYNLQSGDVVKSEIELPQNILNKLNERQIARKNNNYELSDKLRTEIEKDLKVSLLDKKENILIMLI